MLTRQQVTEIINWFENKFPVNDWLVDGVRVWPFLRIKLGMHLYYDKDVIMNKYFTLTGVQENIKNKKISTIISVLKIFFHYSKIWSKKDFLFIGIKGDRSNINQVWVNRFFDFLAYCLEKENYKNLILETEKQKGMKYFNEKNLFFINDFKEVYLKIPVKQKYKNQIYGTTELPCYDEFLKSIGTTDLTKKKMKSFSPENLKKSFGYNISDSNFYYWLLSISKPKYIIESCYYDNTMLAINIAASKLKIPTIEIQHGAQSGWHIAYGNWEKVPENGYEMLPNYFWCWSQQDAKAINTWADHTNYHKAIVLGNPWMEAFNNSSFFSKNFLSKNIPLNENLILFTLQSKVIELPKFLIKSIKNTNNKYNWCFRVHPTQITFLKEISSELDNLGINGCYTIEETSTLPLPVVLTKTALHITEFSGAVKESAKMGIFSIMLHPQSEEIFKEEIEKGLALYLHTADESFFLKMIEEKIETRKQYSHEIKNNFVDLFKTIFLNRFSQ